MEHCWDTALPAVALAAVLPCSWVPASPTRRAVDPAAAAVCLGFVAAQNPKQNRTPKPVCIWLCVCAQIMGMCVGTVSPNSVKWLLGAGVGGSKLEVRLSVLCSIFSRGQDPVFVRLVPSVSFY